jgi:hypothetical protein
LLAFWATVLFVFVAAIGAIALVTLHLSSRKERKPEENVTATSEWQPSGKIDFHCPETVNDDKVPAVFVLRVEDYRTVESISGVQHAELRWRNATLAEAKSVVVAHQKATDTGAKGYQFPRQVEKSQDFTTSAA